MLDTKAIKSATGKIMSFAVPDCLTWPLTVKCSPTSGIEEILDLGMNGLELAQPRILPPAQSVLGLVGTED